MKDPEIKLFGKKIALPDNGTISISSSIDNSAAFDVSGESISFNRDVESMTLDACLNDNKEGKVGEEDAGQQEEEDEKLVTKDDKDNQSGERIETKSQEAVPAPPEAKVTDLKRVSEPDDNHDTLSVDEKTLTAQYPNVDNDQTDTTDPKQKALKKPDKILPCPRCNSMDTKFCYYNNYNVNQPRHFCKSCQRYWTAGGSMRNVPVGAGRRKNKNSASNCRHIDISEALQAAHMDVANGFHAPGLETNRIILHFGSDTPLYETTGGSAVNTAERRMPNGAHNEFHKTEQGVSVSCKDAEKGDDFSSDSSGTTSNSMAEGIKCHQEPLVQNISCYPSQMACLPSVPWPCPWNTTVPLPTICPPGLPMPFFPSPLWNYGVPGPWTYPWLTTLSPSAKQNAPDPCSNSSFLGKHPRDGDLLKPGNPEGKKLSAESKNSKRSILVPKTLRIDDPDEAAKSSIWTTLGIKNETTSKAGLFEGLQPKIDKKINLAAPSSVLQANPAAMSRSLHFQEGA